MVLYIYGGGWGEGGGFWSKIEKKMNFQK